MAATMRILLVGNYPLDNQTSMLRYAEMLCRQLALRGHQIEMIQPQSIVGNLVSQRALRKWLGYVDKYIFFPAKLRSRSLAFDLVHVCDHSNSMYLPHTSGRPSSITCHDLLAIASAQGRYPEQRISATGKVQQRWILKHLTSARHVVCVSAHTARELATFSSEASQDVAIIPNGLNFPYSPASEEDVHHLRERLGLAAGEQYLLHIGGDHWYKNRAGVLRIFQSLSRLLRTTGAPVPRLVMAGQALSQEMRDSIVTDGLAASVIEVPDPSNEVLRSLYTGAAALLFPSLHEGFGWPLIEAQSCGCPVITSNRSPMTEVAGDAALYIDPADESASATLIAASLDRLHLLRDAGFRNIQRFDAERIAEEYERFFAAAACGTTSQAVSGTAHPEPAAKQQGAP
jgi:glycosyltransferase involved in cell wall biosynthesis